LLDDIKANIQMRRRTIVNFDSAPEIHDSFARSQALQVRHFPLWKNETLILKTATKPISFLRIALAVQQMKSQKRRAATKNKAS